MAGEGTVHQQVLTGDLSPVLFIGERGTRGAGALGQTRSPGTPKQLHGPLVPVNRSSGHRTLPFLTLDKGGRKRLVTMTHKQGNSFKNLVIKHTPPHTEPPRVPRPLPGNPQSTGCRLIAHKSPTGTSRDAIATRGRVDSAKGSSWQGPAGSPVQGRACVCTRVCVCMLVACACVCVCICMMSACPGGVCTRICVHDVCVHTKVCTL